LLGNDDGNKLGISLNNGGSVGWLLGLIVGDTVGASLKCNDGKLLGSMLVETDGGRVGGKEGVIVG